jgi:HPt (histidine-containing phosphotransfer) domain-containing protein
VSDPAKNIDMAYLDEMSGGDRDFVCEILATYLETAIELIEAIETAALEGASEKAVYASHTLKGSSRSIGAEPLGLICHELEHHARIGDMLAFSRLASCARPAFEKLERDIQGMFQELAA